MILGIKWMQAATDNLKAYPSAGLTASEVSPCVR